MQSTQDFLYLDVAGFRQHLRVAGPFSAEGVPERSISPSESRSATIALQDFNLMTGGEVLGDECMMRSERSEQHLKS